MKFVNKQMGSLQSFAASVFFPFFPIKLIYVVPKRILLNFRLGFFINCMIAKIWVSKLCLAQAYIPPIEFVGSERISVFENLSNRGLRDFIF
jgi:hypothetical protein